MDGIRSQLLETEALETLARAYMEEVKRSLCALVKFAGLDEEAALSCPAAGFVLAFRRGDFLHIKQEYNRDWLIGRVVGPDTSLGFIPSEVKLMEVVVKRKQNDLESGDKEQPQDIPPMVYKMAPILRPLMLVGPSAKGHELTDLLQKALVSYLKQQFADRLVIVRSETSITSLTHKKAHALRSQVFDSAANDKLALLDCDASLPSEIFHLDLHPIIIYIQISRLRVLQKLARETCRGDTALRQHVLSMARKLYELPSDQFSLVITDSQLDDACQNLELFVETYWASTHPPIRRN